jgi:hypothetical protein
MARLTDASARELKRDMLREPAAPLRRWAEKYGVGKTTIYNVKRGATWRHVAVDD